MLLGWKAVLSLSYLAHDELESGFITIIIIIIIKARLPAAEVNAGSCRGLPAVSKTTF